MRLVIDASIALAWLFDDEDTDGADRIMDLVRVHRASVPVHWHLEIANAFVMAERRSRLSQADTAFRLQTLRILPIDTDWATPVVAFEPVIELARRHRLTVYDAAYLELAIRLDADLATRDQKLADAARAVRLALP